MVKKQDYHDKAVLESDSNFRSFALHGKCCLSDVNARFGSADLYFDSGTILHSKREPICSKQLPTSEDP